MNFCGCPPRERSERVYVIQQQGPRGIMGPQGPKGADGQNVLASYGGMYSTATDTISLSTTSVVLPTVQLMPQSAISYGANALTIQNAGIYEIIYGFSGSTAAAATVTVNVAQNGSALLPSVRTLSTDSTQNSVFFCVFITTLNTGDIITLRATATATAVFTPTSNVNTFLTIKQIGTQT